MRSKSSSVFLCSALCLYSLHFYQDYFKALTWPFQHLGHLGLLLLTIFLFFDHASHVFCPMLSFIILAFIWMLLHRRMVETEANVIFSIKRHITPWVGLLKWGEEAYLIRCALMLRSSLRLRACQSTAASYWVSFSARCTYKRREMPLCLKAI